MAGAPASSRTVHILLVEDDPDQVALLQVMASRCTFPIELHVAQNGLEALKFLRGTVEAGSSTQVQLVLLDLDLPELDGRKVLSEMRADPNLAQIPVVIVSASERSSDVKHAYELQASGYLRKPIVAEDLDAVVRQIVHRAMRWGGPSSRGV